MENNFGMEAIISNGLGFTDSLFNTKKSNFDGDFDSMSLEIGSTENLVNFAETYNELDAYNASQKIRMLKKLHIHTRNVPGKYGKSVENFLVEQSLEDAAALESTGKESGANPKKLPNGEISKQRDSFLVKVWDTLKKLFDRIVNWFKEKLQWIADKIGKRPTTSESIQILQSCTNEESKDIFDALLESDIDASNKSSEQGKVICISSQAINTFTSKVEKFDLVGRRLIACAQTVEKQGGYFAANGNSNLSFNDIIANVNDIRAKIAGAIPGGKQVPEPIQNISKENITKFNKQFKECLSYLKWEHDPEGYAKLFTGTGLISKKAGANAASIASAQYGTTNPSELRKLIPSLTESLKNINGTLTKLQADVKQADENFKKYFAAKERGVMNNNGELKEYKGDSNDLNAVIIYQFASTTMICFRMLNNLIQVGITVYKKIDSELVKLTNVLDKAAKAKKERKWFQFKKKDRDAKKSNDTLKEAGLDTENEEEVDKKNAAWDKLESFEKGAKKAGKKIGKGASAAGSAISKGAQAFGNTKAGTGLRNAADVLTSGVKSTAQDLLGRDKEAANTRKNLEKRINKREANAEKRANDAAKSRMAKDNAKTKTTESWLLNPEDFI